MEAIGAEGDKISGGGQPQEHGGILGDGCAGEDAMLIGLGDRLHGGPEVLAGKLGAVVAGFLLNVAPEDISDQGLIAGIAGEGFEFIFQFTL